MGEGPDHGPRQARAAIKEAGGGRKIRTAGSAERLDAAALILGEMNTCVIQCFVLRWPPSRPACCSVTARHSRRAMPERQGCLHEKRLLAVPLHRRPGFGNHQRRQGAGTRSLPYEGFAAFVRSTDRAMLPTARRFCRTKTWRTFTLIWRRSRRRRTTRPFRCSASSALQDQGPRSDPGAFVVWACADQLAWP